MRGLFVGIDLGTTNSTAVAFDGEQLTPIRNAAQSPLTPSVVRIDAKGNVTVGAKARRMLESDPENTRAEFKRLMGTRHSLRFPAAGLDKRPEELAAEVLRALRRDVQTQLGVLPEQAVLTVPALFELPQTAATSEAARLAGFTKVELLQEPVASALAAGWSQAEDDHRPWLVYDLGGGTFDVSLLESRDGLLRVIGHDGDNFLGGRDIDAALLRHVLDQLAEAGTTVDVEDPANAVALRKLRWAVEEAKIELSREATADLCLPGLFGGADVDLTLDRATLDALLTPLVDRSVGVCRRLLSAHGLRGQELGRVVLVGGPTATPALREQVGRALGAPFAAGLDPMTLVAQGAALFAASSGLDTRPPPAPLEIGLGAPSPRPTAWLQYPTMTSDLVPYVVGKLADRGAITAVRLRREDGWTSDPAPLDKGGSFVLIVELQPRRANRFHPEGLHPGGVQPLDPAQITIVHGVALSDPPLSRTLGVALADDTVHVFLERGSPLPLKRSFTLRTVDAARPGAGGTALKVPIIQGELPEAHLNRLVGALEIAADELRAPLAAGSPVELTLELDRGGQLTAEARLPDGQVFREVAQLAAPQVPPDALRDVLDQVQVRLVREAEAAVPEATPLVAEARAALDEVGPSLRLARGGDLDALEKARRALLDADAAVARLESANAWPRLVDSCRLDLARGAGWIGNYGTPSERRSFEELEVALRRALGGRRSADIKRLRGTLEGLTEAAWARSPGAWRRAFAHWSSRAHEARDLPRAQALVERGREEERRGDDDALRRTVHELYGLMPPDTQERERAWASGVRS